VGGDEPESLRLSLYGEIGSTSRFVFGRTAEVLSGVIGELQVLQRFNLSRGELFLSDCCSSVPSGKVQWSHGRYLSREIFLLFLRETLARERSSAACSLKRYLSLSQES